MFEKKFYSYLESFPYYLSLNDKKKHKACQTTSNLKKSTSHFDKLFDLSSSNIFIHQLIVTLFKITYWIARWDFIVRLKI